MANGVDNNTQAGPGPKDPRARLNAIISQQSGEVKAKKAHERSTAGASSQPETPIYESAQTRLTNIINESTDNLVKKKDVGGEGQSGTYDPDGEGIAFSDIPKELSFETRRYNPSLRINNPDGTFSTHEMMSFESDGRYLAAPTIVEKTPGQLVKLSPDEAVQYALETGEFRQFDSEQKAKQYAEGGYKKGTPLDGETKIQPPAPKNSVKNAFDFIRNDAERSMPFSYISQEQFPIMPGSVAAERQQQVDREVLSDPKALSQYARERNLALKKQLANLKGKESQLSVPTPATGGLPMSAGGVPSGITVTPSVPNRDAEIADVKKQINELERYIGEFDNNVAKVAGTLVASQEDLSALNQETFERIGKKYLRTINDTKVETDQRVLDQLAENAEGDQASQFLQYRFYENGAKAVSDYLEDAADKAKQSSQLKLQRLSDLLIEGENATSEADVSRIQSAIGEMLADPEVKSYIDIERQRMDVQNKYEKGIDQFPQVKRRQTRQQLLDAYFDILSAKQTARTKIAGPGGAAWNFLDWIFGDEAGEQDIKALSLGTGIPEDEVKDILKSRIKGYFGSADEAGVRVPGFLTRIAQSGDETVAKMVMGARRFLGNEKASAKNAILSERLNEYNLRSQKAKLFDDAGKLNLNPVSVFSTMGDGIGQTAVFALPSMVTGGAAAGLGGSAIGKIISAATTTGSGFAATYEDAYQEATQYTDDEDLRRSYALKTGLVNGLSEVILEPAEIAYKVGFGRSAGKKSFDDFAKSFKREGTGGAIVNSLKEFGKVVGMENVEELAALIGETAAKEYDFGVETTPGEFIEDAIETVVTTTLTTLPLGAGAGINANRDRSKVRKESLFEAGNESDLYKEKLQNYLDQGRINQGQFNEMTAVVNTMAQIVSSTNTLTKAEGTPLSYDEKVEIAAQQFRIDNNARLKKNGAISGAAAQLDADTQEAAAIQEGILTQESVPQGTVSGGNIEDQRADIERRRQEELNKTDFEGETIRWDGENRIVRKSTREDVSFEDGTGVGMYDFKSARDYQINAKYDAELAALEQQQEGATTEVFTEQEQAAIDGLQGIDFSQGERSRVKPYTDVIQDPDASLEDKRAALRGLSDQLTAKGTEIAVGEALGRQADLIYDLDYPVAEESAALQAITGATQDIIESGRQVFEDITPVLARIDNADYINEKDLDGAANRLYDLMDRVENSEYNDEQKSSFYNLIEPLIQKLEGYEFRTKTETGVVAEERPTQVVRTVEKRQRDTRPIIEQLSAGSASVTTANGRNITGRIIIQDGNYVLLDNEGNRILSLGEKAINDRDVTIPDPTEVDNYITLDENDNVSAITIKTRDGSLVTFSDFSNSETLLDLAIQMSANVVDVPQVVFDTEYERVEKEIQREVLASTGEDISIPSQRTSTATPQTATTETVQPVPAAIRSAERQSASQQSGAAPQVTAQVSQNIPNLQQIQQDASEVTTGTKVFKRFSPQEQRGLTEGGQRHVEASLLLAADERSGIADNTTPQAQENRIEEYAKQEGIWTDNTTQKFTNEYGEPIGAGQEAIVWGNPDRGVVIKTQDTFQYDNLQQKLDGITLHNAYFPETAIKVIGFGRNSNGDFQVIVEQPFIQGSKLTKAEIDGYLETLGFTEDENGHFSNGEVIIEDVHTGNAIRTPEGNIVVIDPIMRINTPEQGYGGTRIADNTLEASSQVTEQQTREPTVVIEGGETATGQPATTPSSQVEINQIENPQAAAEAYRSSAERLREQGDTEGAQALEARANELSGQQSQDTEPTISETSLDVEDQPEPVASTRRRRDTPRFEQSAILTRLMGGTNVSDATKERLRESGRLKYEVKSHAEARKYGNEVIDTLGIDDAVTAAELGWFHGDVNSMIFGLALDRLYVEEQQAPTPEAKEQVAEKYADIALRYQDAAESGGRFISAVYDFYKKSPAGLVIKTQKEFKRLQDEFFKGREKRTKEAFDSFMETAEGREILVSEIPKRMAEAKVFSPATTRKIKDFFSKLKIDGRKSAGVYLVPPPIYNAAISLVENAVLAGLSIGRAIELGVNYINGQFNGTWQVDEFKKDLKTQLKALSLQRTITQSDKEKILKRWRNRLGGLNEEQKVNLLNKSFLALVENGALEYADFKQMYAEAAGLPQMTPELSDRLVKLAEAINEPDTFKDQLQNAPTRATINAYKDSVDRAERASRELNEVIGRRRSAWNIFTTLMRLNTLGIISLAGNIAYNVVSLPVRFSVFATNTGLDYLLSGIQQTSDKIFGTNLYKDRPSYNVFKIQRAYARGFLLGGRKGVDQFIDGVSARDYFQKQVQQNLQPLNAAKALIRGMTGKDKLSLKQALSYLLEVSPGAWSAEFVARALNFGDKPFRYAAEYAKAEEIARRKGLTGLNKEAFIVSPDEDSQKEITAHGEMITFQQKNVITKALDSVGNSISHWLKTQDAVPNVFYNVAKTLGYASQPFLNTPLNVGNELVHYVIPELSLAQAARNMVKGDTAKSMEYLSKAIVGYSMTFAATQLIINGLFVPGGDDDEQKERLGRQAYQRPEQLNLSGLKRLLSGGNPEAQNGDVWVDIRYYGFFGMILSTLGYQYKDKTPQQIKDISYVEDVVGHFKHGVKVGIADGVFSGTSSLLSAINMGGGYVDSWVKGMANVYANAFAPQWLRQFSLSSDEYLRDTRGMTLPETLQNDLKVRFWGSDKLPAKVNIWGEKVESVPEGKNPYIWMMFGINKKTIYDNSKFGFQLYDLYNDTKDYNVFPPVVSRKLRGQQLTPKQFEQLQILVGSHRRQLVEGFLYSEFEYLKSEGNGEVIKRLQQIYKEGREIGITEFESLYPEFQSK